MRNLLAVSLLFAASTVHAEAVGFMGFRKMLETLGTAVQELGLAPVPEKPAVKGKDQDQRQKSAKRQDPYPFKDADQILPQKPAPPAKPAVPTPPAAEPYPYKDADQTPRPVPSAPPTGKGQDL